MFVSHERCCIDVSSCYLPLVYAFHVMTFPIIFFFSLSLFHFGTMRYLINGEEEHTYFKALTGNRMGKGE